jgi:hypothetical protein
MNRQEALARIAALCDANAEAWGSSPQGNLVEADSVRWIIAQTSSEDSGGVLDRDQALQVLTSYGCEDVPAMDSFLSALAECVRPAAIDRDALVAVLGSFAGEAFGSGNLDYAAWADRILALVRPVAIDRDALLRVLSGNRRFGAPIPANYERVADRVLALVRPAPAGVTLTPEEAATAAACIRAASSIAYMRDDLAALAARLEAAS